MDSFCSCLSQEHQLIQAFLVSPLLVEPLPKTEDTIVLHCFAFTASFLYIINLQCGIYDKICSQFDNWIWQFDLQATWWRYCSIITESCSSVTQHVRTFLKEFPAVMGKHVKAYTFNFLLLFNSYLHVNINAKKYIFCTELSCTH